MKMFRKNRRLVAFITCMALLLSSLAPAISHAMSSDQNGATLWQEICSASGNKFILVVDLDTEKPADGSDSSSASMQHCPYCLTHAGSVGLITSAQLSIVLPDASYSFPELFYHFPYPLFAWAASNPRAPPTSS